MKRSRTRGVPAARNTSRVAPTPKGRGESQSTRLTDGPQAASDSSEDSDSQTRSGFAAYRFRNEYTCGAESRTPASEGSSGYRRVMSAEHAKDGVDPERVDQDCACNVGPRSFSSPSGDGGSGWISLTCTSMSSAEPHSAATACRCFPMPAT